MTGTNDIDTKNEELLALNPELGEFLGSGSSGRKPSKWHNIKQMDPSGETYGSGREADDALMFTKAVQSGEYLGYLHHFWVPLPGGIRMELDHVLINKQMQLEVFETKLFDKDTGKHICTRDWRNKQKIFEATYHIKIQLI